MVWWKAAALMLAETVSLGVRRLVLETETITNDIGYLIDSLHSIRLC